MKTDVITLKDLFKVGYEAYEDSRNESMEIWDAYHNRQWPAAQLEILESRGQPKETFNVIKLFCRMLLGYYATVVNQVKVSPKNFRDVPSASLLNDLMQYIMEANYAVTEGDKIKLGAFISGLFSAERIAKKTGEKDRFGRPIYDCTLEYIHDSELVLDPLSRKDNYEDDARFIHRFKWMAEDDVIRLYGKAKWEQLYEYFNHLDVPESEFEFLYNQHFIGHYRYFNHYLIVHTDIEDDDGNIITVHWSDEIELFRKVRRKAGQDLPKFSYRIHKLHTSNRTEYYGLFREVIESQKAINQAIVKIQLLANTQKVFVETAAVEDIEEFEDAVNRVNSVVEVLDLNGIRVENLSKEILDLYTIIDKAFDRIQRLLGINDSFLGQAFASDSGRKVKLQQNASIMSQRYLTSRVEMFYYLLGWDLIKLVQKYYTAERALLITDDISGQRWITINAPMLIFNGTWNEQGEPNYNIPFEEVIDATTNKPEVDQDGNRIFAPIPEPATEITATKYTIKVESTAYNDEDEKNQLLLETILNGSIGQLLAQINPAGYFKVVGLSLRTMKTKYSPEIARILEETGAMLGGDPQQQALAQQLIAGGASGGSPPKSPGSETLKLPQNTNEGL